MTWPMLHPRAVTISRFADDTLATGTRLRVAGHLARCARCRTRVQRQRELVDAAARAMEVTTEVPPDALLARVLASRAAGVRTVLPVSTPDNFDTPDASVGVPRRRARLVAAAIVAAAAVLAVTMLPSAITNVGTNVGTTGTDAPASFSSLLLGQLGPSVALAQQPPTARPAAPPFGGMDGTRLRPMTLRYERRASGSGTSRASGRGTLAIDSARIEGEDAWRSVQTWRAASGSVETETLYVARASLRPLGRTVHVRPYRRYREITIRQRFVGDSVVGWMHTAEGLGRPIARRLPRAFAPYTTDAFSPLFLTGAPLHVGQRGSVALLGWAVRPEDVFTTVTVQVTGEERVQVPAGTFDCWALTLETGGHVVHYWARKSDGVGVRVRQSGETEASDLVLTTP